MGSRERLSRMTRRSRRGFLKAGGAAGIATMTGLAGCSSSDGGGSDGGGSDGDGGDGGGDGSGGGDGGSTTQGGEGPITIVATIPETGSLSSISQDMIRGYEMGVQRMNDNEVLGRSVEFHYLDDESNPEKVREQMTKLLSDYDVDMIFSSFSDLLIGNQVALSERDGIPLLAIAQSNELTHTENNTKWLFSPFPATRDHVRATKSVLDSIPAAERPSKIGLWVPNEEWSVDLADQWEATLSGDYKIALRETHQVAAQDFSTLISKTESAGVEALLGSQVPPGGITAMKQLADAEYTPKFMEIIRAADTRDWLTALGDVGRYVLMSPGWVPGMTGNGNDEMLQTWRETYDMADDELPPVMTGATYNTTQTAEQALEAAGTAEKGEVQAALRSGTFQTVSGEFGFDDVGRPTDFRAPMGQWLDNYQRLVYPDSDSEIARDLVYPIPE